MIDSTLRIARLYANRLDELKSFCTDLQYRQITCQNAETKIFPE